MNASAEYRALLLSLGRVLLACHAISDAHQDCPGCELCDLADGIGWNLNIFESLAASSAPAGILRDVDRELGRPDWPEMGADEGVEKPLLVRVGG